MIHSYIAVSVVTGAADWRRTDNVLSRVAAGVPGAGDDQTQGFESTSEWIDTTGSPDIWVCTDASTGAAVWVQIYPATGAAGPQGPAGPPGVGQDGESGEDAPMVPGQPGAMGPQGPPGSTIHGQEGEPGEDGLPGIGIAGPPGSTGQQGPIGIGIDGQDADDPPVVPGPMGLPGTPGAMGPSGPTGPPGFGVDGDDGDAFPIPGPVGPQGSPGEIGPAGLTGPPGFGMDGDDGDAFPIPGPVGPQGSPGAAGVSGASIVGADGEPGEDGIGGFLSSPPILGWKANLCGFHMEYVSASTVTMAAGQARDSTDTVNIVMNATATTVDVTSNGAANGNDSFQGAGTVTYTSISGVLAGTSTNFLTDFGQRVMSGTITSSGTTVTGTGTKFLTEIVIGDMIGTGSKSFILVTAIASDTSLTLNSTPGSAFAGEAPSCIEQPTIRVNGNVTAKMAAITSNTAAVCDAGLGNQTNATYRIGYLYENGSGNSDLNIHVVMGTSGVAFVASTQRTTPFAAYRPLFSGSPGVNGYNQYFRRVAALMLNAGSIIQFSQSGLGAERWTIYEIAPNTLNMRVVSSSSVTAWTAINCSTVVPHTAVGISLNIALSGVSNAFVALRKRNLGSATVNRPNRVLNPSTATLGIVVKDAPLDGAQYLDYAGSSGSLTINIDTVGFMESL